MLHSFHKAATVGDGDGVKGRSRGTGGCHTDGGAAPSNGHIIEGSSSVPQFVAAFRFITHFRHGSSSDDDMGNILVC